MFGVEGSSSELSPSRGMIRTAFGKTDVQGSSGVSRTISSRFLRNSRIVNTSSLDAFPSSRRVRPLTSSRSHEPHLRAQRRRVSMCSARRCSDHGVCGREKGVETKRGPWSSSIGVESTSVPLPAEWTSERFGPVEKTAGRARSQSGLESVQGRDISCAPSARLVSETSRTRRRSRVHCERRFATRARAGARTLGARVVFSRVEPRARRRGESRLRHPPSYPIV